MSGVAVHSLSPGIKFGRYAKALAIARGDCVGAHAYSQGQDWRNTPEVERALKTAIAPMSQSELDDGLVPVSADLIGLQRPLTLIGRLEGLQRAPFFVPLVPTQQVLASTAFVEENMPIPVNAAGLDNVTRLDIRKVGTITVFSKEAVQSAARGSELLIASGAAAASGVALDRAFIAPDNSGAGAAPASITYGAVSFACTGTSVASIDSDLAKPLKVLTDADCPLTTAVWIMHPRTATYLSLARGESGSPAYPGMTARGGTLLGLPVLTSRGAETAGSPSEGLIALVETGEIALADEGVSRIEVATYATLQMDTTPSPGPQQVVSLWQLGLAGVKVTRLVNWTRLRDRCVAVLTGVSY